MSQGVAAHQTKLAIVYLFDYIKQRGHIKKARISNFPYDEIVMEVHKDLAEEYKEKLAEFMIKAGNEYLVSNLFSMKAEAKIGYSWSETK